MAKCEIEQRRNIDRMGFCGEIYPKRRACTVYPDFEEFELRNAVKSMTSEEKMR